MNVTEWLAKCAARTDEFAADPEGMKARHKAFIDGQTDDRLDTARLTIQEWITQYVSPMWVCASCGKGPDEGHRAFLGFGTWFLLCRESVA